MNQEISAQALSRALGNQSMANYSAIIAGFSERGIEDIRPRENVFTYHAWQALGRQVTKGQTGVRVNTWITLERAGQKVTIPKTTTVFHISQTEPKC
jgi:hypothetical protein